MLHETKDTVIVERSGSNGHKQISIPQLRAALGSTVIVSNDPGYDEARAVFADDIDCRPSVIVHVADADDVVHVVSLARESELELVVRSGGHSTAGHTLSEGSIVLDLRDMKALHIDPESHTVWAETGLTSGEYVVAAGAYGLATGFGDTGSVEIGDITLGGGVGFLVRKHDLTIAHVMPAPPMTVLPADVHGEMVVMAMMVYAGNVEARMRTLAPFRNLAEPLADMIRPRKLL